MYEDIVKIFVRLVAHPASFLHYSEYGTIWPICAVLCYLC